MSVLAAAPAAHAQAAEPIASYAIDVTLNADEKTLSAHQTITYVNTTDEPIPHLVFHLYLNAFRDTDSIFLTEGGPTHRGNTWDPDHPGWIKVDQIQLTDGTGLELLPLEDGTIASAQLPTPVAPGDSIIVELDFRAQLPRVFARTGYVEDYFMVGQWFPKLGVWEHGAWNAHPFHLNAEFYSDFGNYDVSITLPGSYVTGATGAPISTVIRDNGTQTVAYRAENVIDFAWTASPNFQLSTRDVDGTEVLYLYLPEHKWTVQRVLDAAQAAVSYYSEWYGPYPYPRLTIVDAPSDGQGAGGMEYPTLVAAGVMNLTGLANIPLVRNADRSLEAVTVHEIGHQWWQSMVGFNEAEEPWLDEGLTDYSTLRVLDAIYGSDRSLIDSNNLRVGYLDLQRMSYMAVPRVPMYGQAWDFGYEYSIATYSKPVLSWHTLERTIGNDALLEILNAFFRRYQYGHPTTEDLRTVAEETCEQDLSWFFDGLVYDDEVLNYAVTSINAHSVTVSRQGELSIPTEVRITFVDGSSALESWNGVENTVTFDYTHNEPPIRRAEIDPERKIALDMRWSDNGRSRAPEIWAWLAIVSRILYAAQDALMIMGGF
ncbi:MAG: M1 family metallopeptidase [Anaerolineae bacterium]|nr:M1 family metallopeptidase [Anaerolineae bacterium]